MIFKKVMLIRLEFIILFVMTLFFLSHSVFAEEQLQKSMIEDDANYLSKEKKESIEKEMQHLPEVFRIVFLPKIDSAIDIKGKELFTEKQLPEDTILILAVVDQRKIQIITGEALQKKGLDDTFFQKEIEQYFVPGVKTGAMDQAFIQLTKGISKDIAAGIKVQDKKEKDSPKIPMPPQQVQGSKGKGEEWYPKYLWSIGLLLIAAMIWLIAKTRKKSS